MNIKIFDENKNVLLDLNNGNPWRVDTGATSIPAPDTTLHFSDTDELIDAEVQPRINASLVLVAQKSSVSNLHSAILSLLRTLRQRDNLLGVDIAGTYYYYHIFPMSATASNRLLRSWRNAAADRITVDLTLSGYCMGAEKTVEVVGSNLLPDPSFETLDGWTKIETGSGTVTLSSGGVWGVDYLFGAYALKLTLTGSGDTAGVQTTDYIAIDSTKHYTLAFHVRVPSAPSGAGLKYYIYEYNSDNDLLATTTITATVTTSASWTNHPQTIMHPAAETSEGNHWNADTVKVKIKILAEGGSGIYVIDGGIFASADGLYSPVSVNIPPAQLYGDLPTPAQLILNPLLDGLYTHRFLVGQRKLYSSDWSAVLAAQYGDDSYIPAIPTSGGGKKITLNNLLSNPGFESYTSSGNSTNWDNWAETRSSAALMEADTDHELAGSACVHFSGTSAASDYAYYASLISDAVSVTAGKTYTLLYFYHMPQPLEGCQAQIIAQIKWYDSGGTLISTSDVIPGLHITDDYVPVFARATAPANTATAKIAFICTMSGSAPNVYLDSAWFGETGKTIADVAFAADDASAFTGDCLPIARLATSSAQTSLRLWLAYLVDDAVAGLCCRDRTTAGKIDQDWLRVQFPTARFPRPANADGNYEIAVIFSPATTGSYIYADILSLLPSDGGWMNFTAPAFSELVVDKSGAVADDLSLPTTGDYSSLLSIDPANGANLAILTSPSYLYGDKFEHMNFYAVKIKYTPRYSLVGA